MRTILRKPMGGCDGLFAMFMLAFVVDSACFVVFSAARPHSALGCHSNVISTGQGAPPPHDPSGPLALARMAQHAPHATAVKRQPVLTCGRLASQRRRHLPSTDCRGHRHLGKRRSNDTIQATVSDTTDEVWQSVSQIREVWRPTETAFIARVTRVAPSHVDAVPSDATCSQSQVPERA